MKKLRCWKKNGEKFVSVKREEIATKRLSAAMREKVCIVDKEKNAKCFNVKDNQTPNQALIKLVEKNDRC